MAQQSTTDWTFVISLLGLLGTLFGTATASFTTAFQGILGALTTFNNLKNPTT